MSNTPKLLQKHDPDPVTLVENTGHIIFSGPHNGCAIPSSLMPCLGTDQKWFCKAHEAVDLHMDKLFQALIDKLDDVTFLSGNYSRLISDLNAMPDYTITPHSTEYHDIKIPQNQPDQCCAKQHVRRLDEIYWPYHNEKTRLINQKRENHGGVIVLDLHSFTPTWVGKQRRVEFGTIRCEKTPLSRALEEFLKEQSDYLFISGEPYRVADRPSNAAPLITKNNDIQYLGLEIRNDLIATDQGIEDMVDFLQRCLAYLKSHKNYSEIIRKRSDVMPNDIPFHTTNLSWSV